MARSLDERMRNYLINTAYVAGTSTDLSTSVSRWLKDSTKWAALTNATARLQLLITNSASS